MLNTNWHHLEVLTAKTVMAFKAGKQSLTLALRHGGT